MASTKQPPRGVTAFENSFNNNNNVVKDSNQLYHNLKRWWYRTDFSVFYHVVEHNMPTELLFSSAHLWLSGWASFPKVFMQMQTGNFPRVLRCELLHRAPSQLKEPLCPLLQCHHSNTIFPGHPGHSQLPANQSAVLTAHPLGPAGGGYREKSQRGLWTLWPNKQSCEKYIPNVTFLCFHSWDRNTASVFLRSTWVWDQDVFQTLFKNWLFFYKGI